MKKTIKISDSEWEVMKILWEKPNITGKQIVDILSPQTDWNYRTVKTLISRLVAKEAIGYKEIGNTYSYYPIIKKDNHIKKVSSSFLKKVFNGATAPMLANLIEQSQLSKDDIQQLKQILNEKEKNNDGNNKK